MESIGAYTIISTIGETRGSLVYRCYKDSPEQTVIIKVLKSSFPTPSEIARLHYEYELIRKIDTAGVVKPHEILEHRNGVALVLEDFNGVSLNDIRKKKAFSVPKVLEIGAKIAEILGQLHSNNIIHKDIKPHNILYNEADGRVKITDFGISAEITHENAEIYHPEVINGTLVYMSPEQTGRMNRTVDYRTDMYSLGITFYELLTGRVPFQSSDPMEVIHGHIARQPVSPESVNGGIPAVLGKIVMKLLAKNAEERYQNCYGVLADLKRCWEEFGKTGTIGEFTLGEHDISIRFVIPEKLYGLEKEVASLLASFERASAGGREVTLVTGDPGIGKSSLIGEIERPIAEKRGIFLTGKYDQFRQNVPYSGIIQAFLALVNGILAMNREMIERWKGEFLAALGNGANVITGLIPEFELVIGKQPSLQELGPDETKNRLSHLFKVFIQTIATADHPLALFLDDLQWIDAASLELLAFLINETDISHLLVIGAYRDTEVDSRHPLARKLEEISQAGIALSKTKVVPLDQERVNRLIANAMRRKEDETAPLAGIVHAKTSGNPFFVKQFLKTLYEKKALVLHPTRGWEWSLDAVKKVQGTDNVVDFMIEKLAQLPDDIGEALKAAACIGDRFDLETLSAVCGKGIDEVMKAVAASVEEGFVYHEGEEYLFTHERILTAAYSLLEEEKKIRINYEAGMRVLRMTNDEELEKRIFYIVKHLNGAVSLLAGADEQKRLAQLNLLAGKKARASSAYTIAAEYLQNGAGLLRSDVWENDYTLAFRLHLDLGECEYLNGNFTRAEELFSQVLGKAKTRADKAEVYCIQIILCLHKGKYSEANDLAQECLLLFGIKVKLYPGKGAIIREFLRAKMNMRGKSIDDLYNLPDVTDPELVMLQKVLLMALNSAFYLQSNRFPVLMLRLFNVVLKYGNTQYSPEGYVSYGVVLNIVMSDYRSGDQLYRLSSRVSDKYNDISGKGSLELHGALVNSWLNPAKVTIALLQKAYQDCLASGNLYMGGVVLGGNAIFLFFAGENLEEFSGFMKSAYAFCSKTKNEDYALMSEAFLQAALAFRGLTRSYVDYTNKELNETDFATKVKGAASLTTGVYLWTKLRVYYVFEKYREAFATALELKGYLEALNPIAAPLSEYYYLYSLTLATLFDNASKREKEDYKKIIAHNQAKLQKGVAVCHENYLHKYLHVEAEVARLNGKSQDAMILYKKAIDSARENGFLHNAALGCECAARFYLAKALDDVAQYYLLEARFLYTRWGATAKVRQLTEKYPKLLTETAHHSTMHGTLQTIQGDPDTDTGSGSGTELALDLNTVIRSTQMISGEIVLKNLLEKIMTILVENAGAERGFIILDQNGELCIEAEYDVKTKTLAVLQSHPIGSTDKLSAMIVNYVFRSHTDIVLAHAGKEGQFVNDPYIQKTGSKSILCSPIMNAGRVSGILYMENNLSTGAFVPERLGLLRMISSQVAVSIDNARLYANLEAKVEERTESLNKAMNELWGEMALAKKIQTALLPTDPSLEGYEIVGFMKTADDVGGDYYDVITVNGYQWLIIGDVSGHGVPAGLIMMMAQTAIHSVLAKNPESDPSELLTLVNRVIKSNILKLNESKYMTITVIAVHEGGKLHFSGFHQDLLVYRAKTGTVEMIETRGMWIGILDDLTGVLYDDPMTLGKGDCLLLYTDGVTEALWKEDAAKKVTNMFGVERLKEVFTRHGMQTPAGIRDAVMASLEEYQLEDDVTMLIVKRV